MCVVIGHTIALLLHQSFFSSILLHFTLPSLPISIYDYFQVRAKFCHFVLHGHTMGQARLLHTVPTTASYLQTKKILRHTSSIITKL